MKGEREGKRGRRRKREYVLCESLNSLFSWITVVIKES